MKLKKFFLIMLMCFVLPFSANAAEQKQLIFAIDLIRHGDRTPLVEIPKSPHVWPEGLGALTAKGAQQEKKLGEQMRKRYIDEMHLLPKQFTANTIAIRSTDIERTKLSAKALMSGLYPEATVSIHSVPTKQDNLLLVTPSLNPILLTSLLLQTEVHWQKNLKDLKNELPSLQEKTGLHLSSAKQFGRLADNLYIRYLNHVPFPAGIDDEKAKQIMIAASNMMVQEYQLKELTAPMGTTFLQVANEQIQQAVQETSNLKFILFSAHDISIMAVMNTLGVPMQEIPPYASDLNFSVYRQNQQVFVEVMLNNEPVPIPTCGGFRCDLQQFTQIGKTVQN